MEILETKINAIDERINAIDAKIDKILALLESDCAKMRDHIDFVEGVYENVKMPFNYIMDRANNLVRVIGNDVEDK